MKDKDLVLYIKAELQKMLDSEDFDTVEALMSGLRKLTKEQFNPPPFPPRSKAAYFCMRNRAFDNRVAFDREFDEAMELYRNSRNKF